MHVSGKYFISWCLVKNTKACEWIFLKAWLTATAVPGQEDVRELGTLCQKRFLPRLLCITPAGNQAGGWCKRLHLPCWLTSTPQKPKPMNIRDEKSDLWAHFLLSLLCLSPVCTSPGARGAVSCSRLLLAKWGESGFIHLPQPSHNNIGNEGLKFLKEAKCFPKSGRNQSFHYFRKPTYTSWLVVLPQDGFSSIFRKCQANCKSSAS